MDKSIETALKKLVENQYKTYYVETVGEVVPLVKTLIFKGASVGLGGSQTLIECGVFDLVTSGDYEFIDRRGLVGEKLAECYNKMFSADVFLSSSNAVTENGELYNVDGNSNRVALLAYGPKSVIVIVGKNKIVKNIDEAILRVKTIAAPLNAKRLKCGSPCEKIGHCVSLDSAYSDITDGCHGSSRICCNYLISAQLRQKGRVKVIIVNDKLGY